jgi:YihY family inner membrane protein
MSAMNIKTGIGLLEDTFKKWKAHNAPRMGASVAFYSLLSFAPLLILIAAIIALVFTKETAHKGLADQARQMMGNRGADIVDSLLANAQKPSSGILASVIAFLTLLFGASGVFIELRAALNTIWDAKPQTNAGWKGMLKDRLFSFGMVLSIGFLLLVSLILSTALAFIGTFFEQVVPVPPAVLEAVNFVVSFAVISVLFTVMFKLCLRCTLHGGHRMGLLLGTNLLLWRRIHSGVFRCPFSSESANAEAATTKRSRVSSSKDDPLSGQGRCSATTQQCSLQNKDTERTKNDPKDSEAPRAATGKRIAVARLGF